MVGLSAKEVNLFMKANGLIIPTSQIVEVGQNRITFHTTDKELKHTVECPTSVETRRALFEGIDFYNNIIFRDNVSHLVGNLKADFINRYIGNQYIVSYNNKKIKEVKNSAIILEGGGQVQVNEADSKLFSIKLARKEV